VAAADDRSKASVDVKLGGAEGSEPPTSGFAKAPKRSETNSDVGRASMSGAGKPASLEGGEADGAKVGGSKAGAFSGDGRIRSINASPGGTGKPTFPGGGVVVGAKDGGA
jgi:hypothetical protein